MRREEETRRVKEVFVGAVAQRKHLFDTSDSPWLGLVLVRDAQWLSCLQLLC